MYTITYRAAFSGKEKTRIVGDLTDHHRLARILGDMVRGLPDERCERAADRLARHLWAPEHDGDFRAVKND